MELLGNSVGTGRNNLLGLLLGLRCRCVECPVVVDDATAVWEPLACMSTERKNRRRRRCIGNTLGGGGGHVHYSWIAAAFFFCSMISSIFSYVCVCVRACLRVCTPLIRAGPFVLQNALTHHHHPTIRLVVSLAPALPPSHPDDNNEGHVRTTWLMAAARARRLSRIFLVSVCQKAPSVSRNVRTWRQERQNTYGW